jgi:hypothetical protein
MSRLRQGHLMRGGAIAIVAIFSGAWTFSVAGMGGLSSVSAAEPTPPGLPDGTSVPSEAIDNPASLSDTDDIEGIEDGNIAGVVAASSTNAIPAAALAAYQRAETVINKADESCNITWQLIAAIGRVESNHGRAGGNVLDDQGTATPGVYGRALNGTRGVQAISDTDGGQYDNDAQWDRAVGPLQFIPSTWSVVGVDADNDGLRNPQDVDDAALAAAVYLCSGEDDLATREGQKDAVFRYNNSNEYVNLVLRIMDAYLDGDYSTVTDNTTAGGYVVPDPTYTPPPSSNPPNATPGQGRSQNAGNAGNAGNGGSTPDSPAPGGGGNTGDNGGSGGGDGGGGGGDAGPGLTGGDSPLNPDKDNVPDSGNDGVDDATEGMVDGVLGLIKAVDVTVKCTAYGVKHALDPTKSYWTCVKSYQ